MLYVMYLGGDCVMFIVCFDDCVSGMTAGCLKACLTCPSPSPALLPWLPSWWRRGQLQLLLGHLGHLLQEGLLQGLGHQHDVI